MNKKPDPSFDPVRRQLLLTGAAGAMVVGASLLGWRRFGMQPALAADTAPKGHFEVTHTDAEWRALLTPDQYAVLRQQGTERAFTSPLDHEKRSGTFVVRGLRQRAVLVEDEVRQRHRLAELLEAAGRTRSAQDDDTTLGMVRTEVHCHRCGGHLGHVFDDGPPPTGLRYCMNGVALTFKRRRVTTRTDDAARPRLSRRRADDPQPVHPAGAAVRVRARGSVVRAQRRADAARHGDHVRAGRDAGRGRRRLGGAREPVRPLRRARDPALFGVDTAVSALSPIGSRSRSVAPVRGCRNRRSGARRGAVDRPVAVARCGDRLALGAMRGPDPRLDADRRGAAGRKRADHVCLLLAYAAGAATSLALALLVGGRCSPR